MNARHSSLVIWIVSGFLTLLAGPACDGHNPPPTPGPVGPFRLDGSVVDGPFTVPGVTVTVVSGFGRGLTTRSSASGFFTLEGVAGRIELRLQKEGYPDAFSEIAMHANQRQSFPIGRGVPQIGRAHV